MTFNQEVVGPLPLTPSQENLWEFMRFFKPENPGGSRIVNFLDLRCVRGRIDLSVFHHAVADVARRQDALRVVFANIDNDPLMLIKHEVDPPVDFQDLSGVPEDEQRRWLQNFVSRERFRTFDLQSGPLWNIYLIRLSEACYMLAFSFFHIIFDGWSANILVSEIFHAYQARLGLCQELPELAVGLQAVSEIQRQAMPESVERAGYWRRHLTPLTPLAASVPFPVFNSPHSADLLDDVRHEFTFSDEIHDRLRDVAWEAKTTPYVVLLAAYQILLSRRTGWDRVIIGTTTVGREFSTRNVIGQFTNDIYLAARIKPSMILADIIHSAHATITAAINNISSFKQIARAVNSDFDRERPWPDLHLYHSWFQSAAPLAPAVVYPDLAVEPVEFNIEPQPAERETTSDPRRIPAWIKYGAPRVILNDDRRGGNLFYNRGFFDAEMIGGVIRDYESIVSSIATDQRQAVENVIVRG